MTSTLIKNFIQDKLIQIIIHLLSSLLIILFFNLIYSDKLEILYPISISLFMLLILLTIEWAKYYKFNYSLYKIREDINYGIKYTTKEQKEIARALEEVNKKSKEEANSIKADYEEKIHFLSQWIHNLKTPISVIELIIEKYSSEKIIPFEALENIRVENSSLHSNIEQVLNIIRLQNFERDYEASSVDLMVSLRKVINEKRSQFIYNKVFPDINTEYNNIYVISDEKWNEIILEQIVTNAIKYSKERTSSKKINFTITRDEIYTKLSIKDEGIGIPAYDMKRVFEPFFTGENGRKFRNSTGIGLYICKKVAERLGHELEIKSTPNEGTEVTIKYLSKL